MTAYNTIALHVLAPAMDLIRGTHTMSCLRELEESQWWPVERIEELQSERLRRLITHAYEHVPYYRRVMDERRLTPSDIRSAADLTKLPVLTKAAIVGAGDSILSGDTVVGTITSATYGHRTGENLAMGFVDPVYADLDTELDILLLGNRVNARVVESCRYDPDNTLVRGQA